MSFGWTDIEQVAMGLYEAHPDLDPYQVPFPRLRALVSQLDGFESDPQHNVNEQILEAVQVAWEQEIEDESDPAEDPKEHDSGYKPNEPFR